MAITPYKSMEHALEWVEWIEFSLPPLPKPLQFQPPAEWIKANVASNEEQKVSVAQWKRASLRTYEQASSDFWNSDEAKANNRVRVEAYNERQRIVTETLGHIGTFIKLSDGTIRLVGDQNPTFYDHGCDNEFDDDTVDKIVAYARLWAV